MVQSTTSTCSTCFILANPCDTTSLRGCVFYPASFVANEGVYIYSSGNVPGTTKSLYYSATAAPPTSGVGVSSTTTIVDSYLIPKSSFDSYSPFNGISSLLSSGTQYAISSLPSGGYVYNNITSFTGPDPATERTNATNAAIAAGRSTAAATAAGQAAYDAIVAGKTEAEAATLAAAAAITTDQNTATTAINTQATTLGATAAQKQAAIDAANAAIASGKTLAQAQTIASQTFGNYAKDAAYAAAIASGATTAQATAAAQKAYDAIMSGNSTTYTAALAAASDYIKTQNANDAKTQAYNAAIAAGASTATATAAAQVAYDAVIGGSSISSAVSDGATKMQQLFGTVKNDKKCVLRFKIA